MNDPKIRSGYRVLGESSLGVFSCWYFPTKEMADHFAQGLCKQTLKEYDVVKYLGSWRTTQPVEFVPAEDLEDKNETK